MKLKNIQFTIKSDLLTPVSVYLKVRSKKYHSFLMESSDMHAGKSSKSFIGVEPIASFCVQHGFAALQYGTKKNVVALSNPTNTVTQLYNSFINGLAFINEPHQLNGVFGYTSFNAIPLMEKLQFTKTIPHEKEIPDCFYQLYKYLFIFNHQKHQLEVIINLEENEDEEVLKNHALEILDLTVPEQLAFNIIGEKTSNLSDDAYQKMVAEGIHHCQIGNVFQVVVSRRYSQGFVGDDFQVYRELRMVNPSPYLFYFDFTDFKLFGSSPESVLIKEDQFAYVHPIAGTVRRTGNDDQDALLAEELKVHPKERAEHIMLVDLARNDLSKLGNEVEVTKFLELHYYSHLIHLVSEVKATLAPNTNPLQLLAQVFPAGTLSGAPKYKALQIINDLENEQRSFYGGAIGFIGFNNNINQAIMIRSFLSKNNILTTQAGAGVVVSSTPEGECNEVKTKLAALNTAINLANNKG
jgi:anthranilate synthase component I